MIASEKEIDEIIQKQVDDIDLKKLFLEDKYEPLLEAISSKAYKKEHARSSSAMLPTRASTLKARNAAAALSRPGSSATVRMHDMLSLQPARVLLWAIPEADQYRLLFRTSQPQPERKPPSRKPL